PSHVRPSKIARVLSSVLRARSVSSIRSRNWPPNLRAYSQLKSAVRAPPTWRYPVGDGAKRRRGAVVGPELDVGSLDGGCMSGAKGEGCHSSKKGRETAGFPVSRLWI